MRYKEERKCEKIICSIYILYLLYNKAFRSYIYARYSWPNGPNGLKFFEAKLDYRTLG